MPRLGKSDISCKICPVSVILIGLMFYVKKSEQEESDLWA